MQTLRRSLPTGFQVRVKTSGDNIFMWIQWPTSVHDGARSSPLQDRPLQWLKLKSLNFWKSYLIKSYWISHIIATLICLYKFNRFLNCNYLVTDSERKLSGCFYGYGGQSGACMRRSKHHQWSLFHIKKTLPLNNTFLCSNCNLNVALNAISQDITYSPIVFLVRYIQYYNYIWLTWSSAVYRFTVGKM